MPTSVHIPKALLEAVDRRARALKISRNHLIVRVLEKEMGADGGWSEGFFERLSARNETIAPAVDDLLANIRKTRRSKAPVRL
jgi:metal-responsive CopG/Arc/MetJ family transcriptional regulator